MRCAWLAWLRSPLDRNATDTVLLVSTALLAGEVNDSTGGGPAAVIVKLIVAESEPAILLLSARAA